MQRALTLPQTTIGKKAIMAISGLVLYGFAIGHLIGNLQLYLGPDAMNEYAAYLRGAPALVWGTRILLLVAVVAHIWTSFQLVARNTTARERRYRVKRDLATNYAAKTMVLSGPILLLFLLYHGAWSLFQSMGVSHPRYDRYKEVAATALVAFIVIGNVSFPVMVMAGLVQPAAPYISFE